LEALGALVNLLRALVLEETGELLIQRSLAGGLRNEPGLVLVLEVWNEWLAAFPDVCTARLPSLELLRLVRGEPDVKMSEGVKLPGRRKSAGSNPAARSSCSRERACSLGKREMSEKAEEFGMGSERLEEAGKCREIPVAPHVGHQMTR
jgi:hypothetical protein